MFKTFAIAALAATAIAKGKNDGSDRDNAAEAVLIDEDGAKLTLYTYNAAAEGVNEFHGDLKLEITSGASPQQFVYW